MASLIEEVVGSLFEASSAASSASSGSSNRGDNNANKADPGSGPTNVMKYSMEDFRDIPIQ